MKQATNEPHALRCGAKTRSGEPCKSYAMANGRCRMHGGKSTGPKDKEKVKNNKNAVTTGERESITFDYLDEEEKTLLKQIDLDKIKQIDNDIKLIDIRLRRMMGRIAKLQKEDTTMIEISSKTTPVNLDGDTIVSELIEKQQDTLSQIQSIEDAITRVQSQKLRLIQAKHKLEMDTGIDTEYKRAQIDKLKAQIQGLKGLSDDVEDTSGLRKLLVIND